MKNPETNLDRLPAAPSLTDHTVHDLKKQIFTKYCKHIGESQLQFLYVVVLNTSQLIGRIAQIDEMNEFGSQIQNLTDIVPFRFGEAQIQLI
jgi:hypothetical protein